MRKYRWLIVLLGFLYIGNSYAAEQVTDFQGKDLPVLNEELKDIQQDIKEVVPVGSMWIWTTNTAPNGWLLCYGQAISRTAYVGLYNVIGTTYGAGDSSTTFNVPDMRGRFPLGQDDMGGTSANRVTDTDADTLGGADGDELKDISISGNTGSTTLTSAQSGLPAHVHNVDYSDTTGGAEVCAQRQTAQNCNVPIDTDAVTAANAASGHIHTIAGGSATQDFMNPFQVFNFIIKI